jgi:hypothetical protein
MVFYVSYLCFPPRLFKLRSDFILTTDRNHLELAKLYGSSNQTAADRHTTAAASLKAGILDLLWDSQKVRFFEYNFQ